MTNENSISNLSSGEHFVNGISSISNNLNNDHYSIDRTANRNIINGTSNQSSPNQQQNSIYEYNLAELALLDNQRAQQYIQQQTRHRQNTSAKQTAEHLSDAEEQRPPVPPLPQSNLLLKRNNYYSNIYSAPPPLYTEPDYSLANHHSINFSNPPQYTATSSNIYGQTTNDQTTNLAVANNQTNLENEFNGCTSNGLNNDLSLNKINSQNNSLNHHHLPHHPNQNSLLTSMDGLRVQIARTKKQMAAASAQLNSSNLSSQNGQSSAVSNAAQNIANLVANQPIRAPTIQRSAEMQISLKGWLYRLEGAALKQWKRRWFVLGMCSNVYHL